jgi:hypothetical protein
VGVMSVFIYLLILVMLGLRWVVYETPLAPVPDTIATIALIVGMYSLLFAWIRTHRDRSEPAAEWRTRVIYGRAEKRR